MIDARFRMMPTTPCIARILDEPVELEEYRLEPGVSFIDLRLNPCIRALRET